MGTKCIPSWANIFMGIFEEKYIYPLNNNMKLLYLRYMDHIFVTWTGTLEELIKFREQMDTVPPATKFDFNFSLHSINFTDTVAHKILTEKLGATLYRKKFTPQLYLHHISEHPESLKHRNPFAQELRKYAQAKMISKLTELKSKLTKRGYKEEEIGKNINKPSNTERKEALKETTSKYTNRISLILTYNQTLANV